MHILYNYRVNFYNTKNSFPIVWCFYIKIYLQLEL